MPIRTSNPQSSTTVKSGFDEESTISPRLSHQPISELSTRLAETLWENRISLLEHLDSTDQPISVDTVPLLRKKKWRDTQLQIQDDLFEARLAVKYKVEPKDAWRSLRRYKRFTGKKAHIVNRPNDLMTLLTDGESSGI